MIEEGRGLMCLGELPLRGAALAARLVEGKACFWGSVSATVRQPV